MGVRYLRLLRKEDGEKTLLSVLTEISGHDSVELQKKEDSVDIILEFKGPRGAAMPEPQAEGAGLSNEKASEDFTRATDLPNDLVGAPGMFQQPGGVATVVSSTDEPAPVKKSSAKKSTAKKSSAKRAR